MSIPISQEVDLLYKKAFGVSKTDMPQNKSPSNESIASPALNRGDTAWTQADQIPSIAVATTDIVQAYTGAFAVECTPDTSSVPIGGVNQTWLTNLTNWIPVEFGSTYFVQAWADSAGSPNPTITGTQLFADGSAGLGEWFFDYQAGLLNFIGETIPTALTASKVVYIIGYRYIGLTGVTNLPSGTVIGELLFSNTTIASTSTLEPVTIRTSDTANSATYDWTFDATGNIVLPTNSSSINYANGLPYGGGGGNANIISIPAIYFSAVADGNNQTFSNSFLSAYTSNTDITLFYNGSLLDSPYYTFSGDTITVNKPLLIGDSIDVIRQFASNVVVSTYSNVNVHSYLESASVGNIIPAGNNIASLGNATNQWKDLWVSNSAIYFDSIPLSVDGNSALTFDGEQLVVSGGNQTISTSGNVEASNVVATGDVTGQNIYGNLPTTSDNILYVATNGIDTNSGGITQPFLTIKAAMALATTLGGNVSVHIAPGTYTEIMPITIPPNTALMGDNLRNVFVIPQTTSSDMFYMTSGTYVWGITVKNYTGKAFSYDPTTTTTAYVSPYIQNITSSTTTGTAVYIDGDVAIGTKAMIVGFFTIINRGGYGIRILNSGYSQLVNIYTIACDIGIKVESGGFCTLNGSDCSIGNYGLWAEGLGPLQTSGTTVGTNTNGVFVLSNMSNGQPHVNTILQVVGDPNYYTIDTIVPNTPGANTANSTAIIQQIYSTSLPAGSTVNFYTRSSIIASAHTFEYVGAGTDPAIALPQYGGIPIEINEVTQANGGVVTFTSTDQKGNFKVGDGFTINQATGVITGSDFYQSLFAQMTPYILALGSD